MVLPEHPSDTKVLTMKMEILLEPTSNKLLVDGPATVEMVNATKESFVKDDLAKFQELLLDAKKPLYKGCHDFTKLSAIVKLLNLKEPTHSSPYDSPLTGVNPPRSEEGSLQLAELMALYTSLQRKVDALEKDKLAQATKILSLKKRVEKLEKRRKSKPSILRRLRKIGSATKVESSKEASLGAEENASKQGGMISDIDVDVEISLVDKTQRLDDDLIFDTPADLGGEEM
ncbi:hypothetical protein Tco_1556164 [Tanacetum coccineum]